MWWIAWADWAGIEFMSCSCDLHLFRFGYPEFHQDVLVVMELFRTASICSDQGYVFGLSHVQFSCSGRFCSRHRNLWTLWSLLESFEAFEHRFSFTLKRAHQLRSVATAHVVNVCIDEFVWLRRLCWFVGWYLGSFRYEFQGKPSLRYFQICTIHEARDGCDGSAPMKVRSGARIFLLDGSRWLNFDSIQIRSVVGSSWMLRGSDGSSFQFCIWLKFCSFEVTPMRAVQLGWFQRHSHLVSVSPSKQR